MSLAFGLAHPHWFQLSGKFNPLSLFSAGEQGIAVPDLTPGNGFLFQDSAGTTPVTAFEQPVGLILDRSKGLVLGADVLGGAGSFSSATGWTQGTGWSIGSGVATATSATSTSVSYPVTLTAGLTYRVDITVVSRSGGGFTPRFTGGTGVLGPTFTSAGTYTCYMTAASGNNTFAILASPLTIGVIAGITIRELPGNHIIQATSTKRPTLSARYNLLTYSEQFDNADWTKSNLNTTGTPAWVNVAVAPNGTTTAEKLIPSTANTTHEVFVGAPVEYAAVNVPVTLSVYAKKSEYEFCTLVLANGFGARATRTFNLNTGAVTNPFNVNTTTLSTSAVDVGNGWWRIGMSALATSNNLRFAWIAVAEDTVNNHTNSGQVFVGNNSSGIFIWGADLRRTIDTIGMPAYQRVGASNDYDTAGFFPYLAFDGTDDSMATAASVDFTGTNKVTMFAGVTKLSDAAFRIVNELSASSGGNAGTFAILAPGPSLAADLYVMRSSGSVVGASAVTASASFAAPVTNVLSGAGDIANDICVLRANGAQIASTASDQGTGNYGNYTLFIGARNNASNFFSGRIYPFFIRGAATDATTIAQVEQYIRARMPVNF